MSNLDESLKKHVHENYKDYTYLNKKTSQLYPIQHKINLLIDQILKKRVINEK